MTGIQKSELVIAKILELLMEWGVRSCDLEFQELKLDNEYAPYFFPCVVWLRDEGIIRTGDLMQFLDGPGAGIVSNPVLTSYGMNLMGKEIFVGAGKKSIGQRVKEVSEGKVDYHRIGDAFGGILGGFTKSVSS